MPPRLQTHELLHAFANSVFGVDAALPRTIRDLTLRPGEAVRDHVTGMRKRYVGPPQYFVTALAVLFIVFALRGVEPSDMGPVTQRVGMPEANDAIAALRNLMDVHMQFLIFTTIPFFAFAAGLLQRRSGLVPAESAVLFLYVVAPAALLGGLPRLVIGTCSMPPNLAPGGAGLAYYVWAARGFNRSSWWRAAATVVVGYCGWLLMLMTVVALVLAVALTMSA